MNNYFVLPSIVLFLAGCMLATSCGIQVSDQAEAVPDAPDELVQPGSGSQVAASAGSIGVLLYFTDPDDNFYAVQRNFSDAPTVNDLLDGIVQNPERLDELVTDGEIDGDVAPLRNLITTNLNLKMEPKDGGFDTQTREQTVTLSSEASLREAQPGLRTTIFTQIVCTLTQEDFKIDSVRIYEVNGTETEPIFARDASGAPNNGASKRSDYACDEAEVLAKPATKSGNRTKRSLELEELSG